MVDDHPSGTQVGHKVLTSATEAERLQFGGKVREARRKLNWTQTRLAEQAKMHGNTISNIETGKTDNLESRRIIKEAIDAAHEKEFSCPFVWVGDRHVETSLSLNKESLLEFIRGSEVLSRIDQAIVTASKVRWMPADSFMGMYLERLFHIAVETLSELAGQLSARESV